METRDWEQKRLSNPTVRGNRPVGTMAAELTSRLDHDPDPSKDIGEENIMTGRIRDRQSSRAFFDSEPIVLSKEEIQKRQDEANRIDREKYESEKKAALNYIEAEILLQNNYHDSEFQYPYSSREVSAGMSPEVVRETNIAEAKKFMANHPEYHITPENGTRITEYLISNVPDGYAANQEVYEMAYSRLNSLGLLEQKPQPVKANLEPGKPKEYTKEEIEKMSSEEYARAFNLKKARPEDALPAPSGYVPVDPAVAPIKRDGREESADAYRARLARSGISTRIPPKAPWGPNA
jgi:hypothetical protein